MKISTKGRCGIRSMLILAKHYGEHPIPVSMMATLQGKSRMYVHGLLTSLRRQGLVKTTKGSQGGFTLSRPPSRITLKEMLHALEGPLDQLECFDDIKKIKNPKTCRVRKVWAQITKEIERMLTRVSLADISDGKYNLGSGKPKKQGKR